MTLVCNDIQQIDAHNVIMSIAINLFKNILTKERKNSHMEPFLRIMMNHSNETL